jgi:hypothetical protein
VAKAVFKVGDRTMLLKAINKQDNKTTIRDVHGRKLSGPSPRAGSRADTLVAKVELGNRREVRVRRADTKTIGSG